MRLTAKQTADTNAGAKRCLLCQEVVYGQRFAVSSQPLGRPAAAVATAGWGTRIGCCGIGVAVTEVLFPMPAAGSATLSFSSDRSGAQCAAPPLLFPSVSARVLFA